jgi:hypothetical protein
LPEHCGPGLFRDLGRSYCGHSDGSVQALYSADAVRRANIHCEERQDHPGICRPSRKHSGAHQHTDDTCPDGYRASKPDAIANQYTDSHRHGHLGGCRLYANPGRLVDPHGYADAGEYTHASEHRGASGSADRGETVSCKLWIAPLYFSKQWLVMVLSTLIEMRHH